LRQRREDANADEKFERLILLAKSLMNNRPGSD
jgi:hypothetical protein